ncbi:MAG: transposase [Geminicoccaceae bacterium]
MQATLLWSLWQALLTPFAPAFTPVGFRAFVVWITGLSLNVEEHTITQSLIALGLPERWKGQENFAEVGHWNQELVEWGLADLLEEAPGRLWYGYRVHAIDDSKVHRSSKDVWGTCTFHDYSARCPNRAQTVRAHNWVVLGDLLRNDGAPAWFLPLGGRLYFRHSQLPTEPEPEPFRTKNELAVELLQAQAEFHAGQHLAVFDGAFAVGNVVRPLVRPEPGQQRIDFVTRLRHDARLCALAAAKRRQGQRGPLPKWGPPLPPPRQGGRWPGGWHEGEAFLYGRVRHVRWKEVVCLWRVLGWQVPVKAVVAEVEGYRERFHLVSSALELTGLQVVELFCARFRQEDGFRDLKQRLGWEECRAWTKKPVLRTSWAQMVTMSLLRLLQLRLEQSGQEDWWLRPPWNKRKARPSILDVERLLRGQRAELAALLRGWLEMQEKEGEKKSA